MAQISTAPLRLSIGLTLSTMLLAAYHSVSAQSSEPDWKSAWEEGDFSAISLGTGADDAGALGAYVSEVSRVLCPLDGVVDPAELPQLPQGVASFWRLAEPLISAIACQRAYRFEEAQSWAEFAQKSTKVGSSLHARAELIQLQCENALKSEQAWAPLRPLETRFAPKPRLLEAISSGESGGRWVPVPDELRSRHDRKSGFQDDLFLAPSGDRAWFASDRTGDGDTDLYVVEVMPDGDFGQITEAPNGINSPYAEQSPWWQPGSEQVYFSSDRPASLGGLDVFVADLAGGTASVNPLPFAVNTPFNETHFTPHDDRWTAWFLSDRAGEHAYRVVREFESRKPITLTIQLPNVLPAQVEMKLDLWDAETEQALWSGVVAGGTAVRVVVPDGTRVLALLSDLIGEEYTWKEWQVPVVTTPSTWRVALHATADPVGLQAPELEAGADLDSWPVNWSLARASDAPNMPRAPIANAALPEAWHALGETNWWQKATSEERAAVVRALRLTAETLELPEAPNSSGWALVEEGLEWNAACFESLTAHQNAFQQALDLVCESEDLAGWTDACAAWIASREEGRRNLEQGLIWSEMSQTLSPLQALATANSKVSQTELDWFNDAETVLLRAMKDAYTEANWQHLLETKLVWRDWLFAHWVTLMDSPEAAHFGEQDKSRAYWEMEQSFANPVWNNLESFAFALLKLIPHGRDSLFSSEISLPPVAASLSRAMQPMFAAQAGVSQFSKPALPSHAAAGVDSVYVIQLGAYAESPNPWAFYLSQSDLKQASLDNWNKVFYGGFITKDSAKEFLQVVWAGRGFEDAFIQSFSREEWERMPSWNADLELHGYGIQGKHHDASAVRPAGGWSWPAEDGGWVFWYGPFAGAIDVERWLKAAPEGMQWQRIAFGNPAQRKAAARAPAPPAPPAVHPNPSNQLSEPDAEADASRWVIRVAEFPLGAPASARAALLRLPAQVRSIPWGAGDAFISNEVQGEEDAMKLLQAIQSQGFPDARLLPVHVD